MNLKNAPRYYDETMNVFVYVESISFVDGTAKAGDKTISLNNLCYCSGIMDITGKPIYEDDVIEYVDYYGETSRQVCPKLAAFHFWEETRENPTCRIVGDIHIKKC